MPVVVTIEMCEPVAFFRFGSFCSWSRIRIGEWAREQLCKVPEQTLARPLPCERLAFPLVDHHPGTHYDILNLTLDRIERRPMHLF